MRLWLRLYQVGMQHLVPAGRDQPLWWTLRRPFRPLTYDAARAMFTRANAALGANWSLHDLRHSAAYRMVRDPGVSLTDVQWVLGHAHLSTTQRYVNQCLGIASGGRKLAGCLLMSPAPATIAGREKMLLTC
jgi:site-specific recombinase XerD